MKKFIAAAFGIFFCMLVLFPTAAFAEEENETEVTEETVPAKTPLFKIYYECRGGDFDSETFIKATFYEDDTQFVPPTPFKAGYIFGGWFTSRACNKQVDVINKYSPVIVSGGKGDDGINYIRVYAKWIPIVVPKPYISYFENPDKGTITVNFNSGYGVDAEGYELQYAYDDEFTKGLRTVTLDSILKPAELINKMSRNYYFRARAFVHDETGEVVYSDYCVPKVFFIKNGATEIEPTPSSGVINSATISGGSVVVSATVEQRVATYDDCYYLVKINPSNGGISGVLTTFEKETDISSSFPVSGNLMAKFALAVKTDENNFSLISSPSFIDNPEALAPLSIHNHPKSVKGRQGKYSTSAGDKNTFHNVYLDDLLASSSSYDVAYNYNGRTYYFYTPTHGANYNELIRSANADGGTVSMQLMLRYRDKSAGIITPTGRTPGYNYYAFNMEETDGREKVEALFMFLAEYWSKSNLHVDNWILGNEVNTYLNTTGRWYWAGNISHESFMTNYSNTFRCLYYAVKSHNAAAQVYTCCDHTWNNRDNDWGAMGFMSALNSHLKAMNSHIQWNVAYHAYTAVLTNADPWNDGAVRLYSVAHSTGASFVTPYNLEVLNNFVANNFGSGCRIILSEVGFSSTGGVNPTLNGGRQAGASVQAAATAYLYFKAQFSSNIDACIYHTGDEGEPGKNFAIENNESWNVYRFMDTPQYASYTNGYLGIIGGAKSWESIIPGFNSSTLAGMPNR